MNPFIHIPYYPAFDAMTPENAKAAFQQLLPEARAAIDALEKNAAPTWQGLMTALYDACHPLYDAWGLLNHLLSVVNSEAWREAQESVQPEIVAFSLRVGQSKIFYDGFRALRDADTASPCLTDTRRRILAKVIQEAEHAGVGLRGDAQARFNAIQTELAQLATTFRNNVLDATKAFSLTLDTREDVEGLPDALLTVTAQQAGGDPQQGPWRITLDAAVYVPFMMHSANRAARETLYRAFVTRASSGGLDNTPVLERTLTLKREMANLLGYPTYADLNLSSKTARTVAAVDGLIAQLAAAAHGAGRAEMDALTAFARASGFGGDALQPWDIAFWAERQREKDYDYSEAELSKYLPYPNVLDGLFSLAQRLFGIRIVPADGTAPVWHPDVRFYNVLDADGTTLAGIYSDPYSRPATKSGGAWMNEFRTRRDDPGGCVQRPLALMACNQTVPVGDAPPLMRFDEVRTLFHEFGHVLQHLLATELEPDASGINGVEWDAVEFVSQLMECFCRDASTLRPIARHHATDAPIPPALLKAVLASRNHHAAHAMARQVHFSLLDLALHMRPPPFDAHAMFRGAAGRMLPVAPVPEDRSLCAFSHIFSGGYAAGYYGYKWAEVMAADAFGAFERALRRRHARELAKIGREFRGIILAPGGGRDPLDTFREFRGRNPDPGFLLRKAGLAGDA